MLNVSCLGLAAKERTEHKETQPAPSFALYAFFCGPIPPVRHSLGDGGFLSFRVLRGSKNPLAREMPRYLTGPRRQNQDPIPNHSLAESSNRL
jgi:hypothetical protein